MISRYNRKKLKLQDQIVSLSSSNDNILDVILR